MRNNFTKFTAACSNGGNKSAHLGYLETAGEAHRAWQLAKIERLEKAADNIELSQLVRQSLYFRVDKIKRDYECGFETVFV